MSKLTSDYWRMRESQERAAAASAGTEAAREIHAAMAERYADRAWGVEEADHEQGEI